MENLLETISLYEWVDEQPIATNEKWAIFGDMLKTAFESLENEEEL